jgi:short-subunit dehydrogenase
LERQYKITVYTIGKDLSLPHAAQEVYDEIKSQQIQIDYLVNNAGFGDFGMFVETDWNKELQMINLNITTLTHFTKLYVRDMVKRGSGKILNVASTAAFQSGPTMAVYYATKAYVLSFSEALDNEVSNKGVSVTTLCPGPTESGFQAAAAMEESNLVKGKKLPSSREVAEYGYASMMKGKTVAIHGMMNYLMANSVRFLPRALVVKVTRMIQDKA